MADIGTGTIILLVLWIVTLFGILLFCAAGGNFIYLGLLPVLISTIVTIVLVLIPREGTTVEVKDETIYSYNSLIWILILTFMILSLVVGLVFYFVLDIMQPRYAKVGKQIYSR